MIMESLKYGHEEAKHCVLERTAYVGRLSGQCLTDRCQSAFTKEACKLCNNVRCKATRDRGYNPHAPSRGAERAR